MISDEQLAARAQDGDAHARDTLVGRFVGLAYSLAREFYTPQSDRDDLRQEALLGLLAAVRSYRPDRGASFMTFAANCIRRWMFTVVRRDTRVKHALLNGALSLDREMVGEFDERVVTLAGIVADPRAPSPLELLLLRERLDAVVRTIRDELSPLESAAVVGRLNGETYAETEARLTAGPDGSRAGRAQATPVKVVDNALTRARRKIAAALADGDDVVRPLGAAA